jgi:hypothetical protein
MDDRETGQVHGSTRPSKRLITGSWVIYDPPLALICCYELGSRNPSRIPAKKDRVDSTVMPIEVNTP